MLLKDFFCDGLCWRVGNWHSIQILETDALLIVAEWAREQHPSSNEVGMVVGAGDAKLEALAMGVLPCSDAPGQVTQLLML
ncbi:hypothetical protein Ancab_010406 [Ancistrocladus abbreviatus]